MGNIEQADGTSKRHPRWHRFIKKMKARLERFKKWLRHRTLIKLASEAMAGVLELRGRYWLSKQIEVMS